MAIRYYDDAITAKIQKWLPTTKKLRVLKPNETKRLFELNAIDSDDKPFTLPLIAVSRDTNINLLSTTKQARSYEGLRLATTDDQTLHLNIIPIKVSYQIDIYTKTMEESEEYLRSLLFKLINNPQIVIEIPYNNTSLTHTANLRVADSVSDNSDISERVFSGQFYRWTINVEVQDAFLFNIPYRKNWKIDGFSVDILNHDWEVEDTEELNVIASEPIYKWADSYWSCYAQRTIKRLDGDTETVQYETAIAKFVVESEDEEKGKQTGYFLATFDNPAFSSQKSPTVTRKYTIKQNKTSN